MNKIYKKLIEKITGFTLVELIVAISVMSVLSGVAIPSYITLNNRSKESGTESMMRNTATALEIFRIDNDRYPLTEDGIISLEENGYLKEVPENDLWKNQFAYVSEDGYSYTLRSYGVDGTENTDDDIVFSNGTMIADGGYGKSAVKANFSRNMVVGLSLDEGSGYTVSYGDIEGTVSGAEWTDGFSGTALKFGNINEDGLYSYASLPDSGSLDLTTEGTLQAWINIDSIEKFSGIIHKGNKRDFSDEAYTLQFYNRKLTLALNNGEGFLDTNYRFETGKWYHVAGTWDNGGMSLYVNGVKVNSTDKAVAANVTDGDVQIGAQLQEKYNSSYSNFGFVGSIDEVQIYDKSLSPEELQEYYSQYD